MIDLKKNTFTLNKLDKIPNKNDKAYIILMHVLSVGSIYNIVLNTISTAKDMKSKIMLTIGFFL